MVRVHPIDSFDLPALAPYRTLRYQDEHRRQGIFVAEGEKVVRRLIQSPLEVISVMLPEKWEADFRHLLEKRPEDVPLFVGPKELLEELTGFTMYQGVLATARVPAPLNLDHFLDSRPRPWLLAAADELANAQNMGVLVRNCAAFRADALLVGETSCSPFLRRAVRASMGAIFNLPAFELPSLAATLQHLRRRGIRCVAAHPSAKQRILPEAELSTDCCIVLGSEGQGLNAAVLEQCDEAVAIPMPPTINSLNVGSAGAIFLYEAARQRGFK